MTQAIDIIKDEHRSMAAVIKGLQEQVAKAQQSGAAPDWFLFAAMLDYIQAYPDRLHHPKEDEYLFRYLRLRHPPAAPLLDTLEAQHGRCGELLEKLRQALEASRTGNNVGPFADALEQYANFQWDHMAKEEEGILPLAEAHLTEADWAIIDRAFAANRERIW